MSYELIISEKPAACKKIAEALADSKPIKKSVNKVPYYELSHNKNDIIVGCAVGHLYTVAEKDKGKWTYPVFNLEWVPSYEKSKQKYSKKYINLLKKLSKKASSYTVACDYDIEGEVIGLNVVRFICKQKDANRMKFSTLTKGDLKKSYDVKSKHLDWGQANAGETRHFLDWMYGINLSRALTLAIKAAGRFKVLSSGRVQGPALKIIVDKEKEIKKFKPEKYWQLQLLGKVKKKSIEAYHEKDKFNNEKDADNILKKTKGKDGKIKEIKKNKFKQKVPFPFDLTTLQTEAHRSMGISPKETLALAQRLYIKGLISYPRTSSQKLPKEIGYKNIIQKISRQKEYKRFCSELLKTQLIPTQGSKTDAAHPAIYPTGVVPKAIKSRERKIYDLIVRRFMSVFGEDAVRETIILNIGVNSEIFIAKGTKTIKQGWFKYYGNHVKIKEEELPEVEKNDEVKVRSIKKLEKETQPPRRFTESSIIRELEKRNLGTKATRAQIVESLYDRGYVMGKSIEATLLGIKIVDTLEKYCPEILDVELTKTFEEEMEEIREKKKTEEQILKRAKKELTKILKNFKEKEKKIGEGLLESYNEEDELGKCPKCGGTLKVMYSRKTKSRFVACSNYPDCKVTYKIPQRGTITKTGKVCEKCKLPIVKILNGRRKQEICLNPDCPNKKVDKEEAKEIKEFQKNGVNKKCPKCGHDLVLRSSVYGKFIGCSNYPKCKYTEKINGNGK